MAQNLMPAQPNVNQNDEKEAAFDPAESTFVTLTQKDLPFSLVCKYVAGQVDRSFQFAKSEASACDETDQTCSPSPGQTALIAGLGLHRFQWHQVTLYMHMETHGEPLFDGCGATLFRTVTIYYPNQKGQQATLKAFLDELIALDEERDETTINVYSFHTKYSYWRKSAVRPKRPLSSIFSDVKDCAVADLQAFLSKDSRAWYQQHGIPYKRNYMFYGPPGSGKTSLIQALASHFDRNLCFIQPCHPDMTDDSFKTALQSTPQKSVIILEDIDSLFASDRSKRNMQCPLTFSGFLNGLDGLGAPHGQVIMMTTNHMERLDPALIRAGRMDIQLEMSNASAHQLADMFLSFYPNETESARVFANLFTSNHISMARAQNHFIRHRLSDAHTAATQFDVAGLQSSLPLLNTRQSEPSNRKDKTKNERESKSKTPEHDRTETKSNAESSADRELGALLKVLAHLLTRAADQSTNEEEEE